MVLAGKVLLRVHRRRQPGEEGRVRQERSRVQIPPG
jgi:hypothetical protein